MFEKKAYKNILINLNFFNKSADIIIISENSNLICSYKYN